jgi:hypothetical protein
MDQATIHTSDKIMEKIEEWKKKNLEIFWLPAYSPKVISHCNKESLY